MKYLLRSVRWEYDEYTLYPDRFDGISRIYDSRAEAEEEHRRIESAAYLVWGPRLLLVAPEDCKQKPAPEAILRFFVDRLGAPEQILTNQPKHLRDVLDLPFGPSSEDIDELCRLMGADFIHIVELPDAVRSVFRGKANPACRVFTPTRSDAVDRGDDEWKECFVSHSEAIWTLYDTCFFRRFSFIRIPGTLEELAVTPSRLEAIVDPPRGLNYENTELLLTRNIGPELLLSVHSLLKVPPIVVNEVALADAPKVEEYGKVGDVLVKGYCG